MNERKRAFEVLLGTRTLPFPYAKTDPRPTPDDRVTAVKVDPTLGREGFVYVLTSGHQGTVLAEQILEYNQDPAYMRDLLLYKLTVEAQDRIARSPLSRREIIRRMRTSPAQLYRILDQTNYRKSLDQVLTLLHVLDCEVDVVVRSRSA